MNFSSFPSQFSSSPSSNAVNPFSAAKFAQNLSVNGGQVSPQIKPLSIITSYVISLCNCTPVTACLFIWSYPISFRRLVFVCWRMFSRNYTNANYPLYTTQRSETTFSGHDKQSLRAVQLTSADINTYQFCRSVCGWQTYRSTISGHRS